jgi:hypothetical protein
MLMPRHKTGATGAQGHRRIAQRVGICAKTGLSGLFRADPRSSHAPGRAPGKPAVETGSGQRGTVLKGERATALLLLAFLLVVSGCGADNAIYPGQPGYLRLGIGDRFSWSRGGEEVSWYQKALEDGFEIELVEVWLEEGWDEGWLTQDDLNEALDRGVVPVIMHYYFAENISKEYVQGHLSEWYDDLERLASVIDIDREVWVVLEPEFNDEPSSGTPITEWEGWNDAVIGAVERIREIAPEAKISICAGDFSQQDLELCLSRAAQELDFLSFQEMRASTYWEPSSSGRLHVADSAMRFSRYLRTTFNKPILFAYLAVSTYADGDSLGWENEQALVINQVFDRSDELLANGVFGLVYFEYYDDPLHSGFFGEAEKYFGLMTDTGQPKQGWHVFREKSREISRVSRSTGERSP